LRIALFGARGIPHTYSGTETFFGELAPRLAARGHDVIVYCRRSLFSQRPATYKGVRLIYLPSIETKNLSTPSHTLFCVLDVLFRNVDVMLVTNVANSLHCVVPRLFGKKVAINVDGVEWKRSKWSQLGQQYFYLNARLAGKICPDSVITDAVAMQQIYLEEFGTRSVSIAYGGNLESSTDPGVLKQYGLEPFQYYLIASRLVPENNADLIVKGFEQADTNKLLVIAGGANYRSEFVASLKRTNNPRVRFLGHVDNSEHIKELHCNCFGYIHGHSVGGTNPALLKALGYGNCILALDNAFNREVIADCGILFSDSSDLAENLRRLEQHPNEAARYREKAPGRILSHYSWDHITDQYEDYFGRLVRGEKPALDRSLGMYEPISKASRTMACSAKVESPA